MMYIILLLILGFLVLYFTSRWISAEAREAIAGARTALRIRRGGRTAALLVDETRAAFQAQALEPDLIIVSHNALDLYDRLRARVIDRADRPDLPNATVLALGADIDAGRLYLRAIDTPAGQAGRETASFHSFDTVTAIETTAHEGPEGLVPPGQEAVALILSTADPSEYRLAAEPAWHLSANDLARRLRSIIQDRSRPAGAPVILR